MKKKEINNNEKKKSHSAIQLHNKRCNKSQLLINEIV